MAVPHRTPHRFCAERCGYGRPPATTVRVAELESALRSIAAPVCSRSGQVAGAVNVAAPWSPAAMSELVSRLGPTVGAIADMTAARVI